MLRRPPFRGGQSWTTFLLNQAEGIASIDLFTVPTFLFEELYVFVVLNHARRKIVLLTVTGEPTAMWLAQQITEAFPWDSAPKFLIRDNDVKFGGVFKRRVRAMGIRDRPTGIVRLNGLDLQNLQLRTFMLQVAAIRPGRRLGLV